MAKLRGVESNGMILAEDELAIGTEHAGIMVLDEGLEPGTPLAGVLPIATDVLELEVTPNRPDCLAVYGVAREVHAATGAPLAAPPWARGPRARPGEIAGVEVVVEARDLCPRFTARAFEDVTIGPSPPWLKARLMAAGQRPINNVVDITNYVMLLRRQPAARLRPRPRRRRRGSSCAAPGTASRSPRSTARCARSTPRCSSSTTPTARPRSPASWAASAPRSTRAPRAC